MTEYRVGNHQPQNIYRGDTYIGVAFNPIDAAAIVRHLNMGLGECTCNSYEPCHGECCGVGMCSCSATDEEIARVERGLGLLSCICEPGEGRTCPRHGAVISP